MRSRWDVGAFLLKEEGFLGFYCGVKLVQGPLSWRVKLECRPTPKYPTKYKDSTAWPLTS